jgi:hypothetical protein
LRQQWKKQKKTDHGDERAQNKSCVKTNTQSSADGQTEKTDKGLTFIERREEQEFAGPKKKKKQ